MPRFDPQPKDSITINSTTYKVMPHPAVPAMAFGQEGRKAIVYQLSSNGNLFALKIFKQPFRDPGLVNTCQTLSTLVMDGLEVCTRDCFTYDLTKPLLKQYPEMEYAVLMPWIRGSTWFDILVAETSLTEDASKKVAKSTADVLTSLEDRGFAHCDIAAANVIVNTGTGVVSLIDVEDMFGPGLSLSSGFPQGTDGYQHQTSRNEEQGQWCPEGDRFSSAILLAEMLAWHSPEIQQSFDPDIEHFFDEDELQDPNSSRYELMVNTLGEMSKEIADCFTRAWESKTLTECPPLSEWAQLLKFEKIVWLPIEAPPPPPPYQPEFLPPISAQPTEEYKPDFVSILPPGTEPDAVPLVAPFCWTIGLGVSATLRWQLVPGAEGYIVEESANEDFTNPVRVYEGPDTSFSLSGKAGDPAYYRVCAYNSDGSGAWSKIVNI